MSIKIHIDADGLDFDLSKRTINVSCPTCGMKHIVTLGQVQRGERLRCSQCNSVIRLVDKGATVAGAISNVNSALDDLKRTLNGLGG